MSIRKILEDMDDDIIFADGLDDALVGYASVGGNVIALYDKEKAIQIIESDDDFFEYNVEGAYVGDKTPAFATFIKVGQHNI